MATKYSQKFPIPQGFAEILHDFTREILRDQPDDIIEYSTLYFEALHQGKPFHYESKYNVKPDKPQGSHYLPHEKKEFDPQNPPQKVEKAEKIDTSVSRERPSEIISERSIQSRDTSHKDEKSLAREYLKDLNEEILEHAGAEEKTEGKASQTSLKQTSNILDDKLIAGTEETRGAADEEATGEQAAEEETAAKEEAVEQAAEETAEQAAEQAAEEAAEEAADQAAEENAAEPTEEAAVEQPAEEAAVEQPAEEAAVEQPAEEAAVEQPAEEAAVEQPAEEAAKEEAQGEEAPQGENAPEEAQ